MADKKISQLTAATTPLAGSEVLPIVQSSTTVKVSVADVTKGRTIQTTGINDNNNNEVITITTTASAVNEITVANAATGANPVISATGSDTDIGITLTPKGSGNAVLTSGNLVVASGNGIDFSATAHAAGMTSELLDDYEEGTWTPTVATGITTPTYVTQTGTYTKIGNTVFARCYLSVNGGTLNGGALTIGGLPFAPGSYDGRSGSFAYVGGGMQQASSTDALPTIQVSSSDVYFYKTTGATFTGTSLSSSTFRVDFTCSYAV